MIVWLLRSVIFIFMAIAIAFLLKSYDGNVIILLHSYRIDLAISLFVTLIIISFVSTYYIIRLVVNINRIPEKIRRWRQTHAILTSRKYLNIAGINFFEAKYRKAHKNAILSINAETNPESKFISIILAYKAANQMRDHAKESNLLDELDKFQQQKWQLAKAMVFSENMYNAKMYRECLDGLNKVLLIDKKHITAKKLLLKTFINLKNYYKAQEVLLWLLNNQYLDVVSADNFKIEVYDGLFKSIADSNEVNAVYRGLHKDLRSDIFINKFYFLALIRVKDYVSAVDFILDKKSFHVFVGFGEHLVNLSKLITQATLFSKLQKFVDIMILDNSGVHELYLANGILLFKLKDYHNAKIHLEQSIKITPSIDAYLFLMFVADLINDDVTSKMANDALVILANGGTNVK